jgi:hypothetical protein
VELLEHIEASTLLPDQLDVGYRVLLDKDQRTARWKQPSYQAHIPARRTSFSFRLTVPHPPRSAVAVRASPFFHQKVSS